MEAFVEESFLTESLLKDLSKIEKFFVTIEMDGQPFRVRIYKGGDTNNKALVLLSGYVFALRNSHFFDNLAKKYNLFVIEQGSFGLNSRPKNCSGSESPDKSEEWMIDFLDKVIQMLDLPEKFLVLGYSMGCHNASLLSTRQSERIEAFMAVCPSGFESAEDAGYDLENIPIPTAWNP